MRIGGNISWERAYAGYRSALDWPTAAFSEELFAAYPDAKFLLTIRSRESWYKSFSETIYPLVQVTEKTPQDLVPFLDMVQAVMAKTGFRVPATRDEIMAAHDAHLERVKRLVPEGRLLVFDVKQGWEPLCQFLGVPVPAADFPRTNNTQDFWNSVQAG